ncbi:MAG: insulinase family protein, partial [Bacteroidetes bacterium]|nr:insulinase family protein [Bacteroidota bacterium]
MRQFSLTMVVALMAFLAFGQEVKTEVSQPIPLNPDVKTGQLSNGIKYYIQKNVEPENRMELRLAVNAGSMQETDEQQGLAHFCEHMAFNGTQNFEKNEIVDYLESIGTRFGAHLNAYTSFDETVYMLQAPTDDNEIMDKAFLILSDWAGRVTFEDEEVEKERGVVIEEWRLGQGANERMRKEWFPVVFKDSRYAERLPIGKKDILESFNPKLIRDFYKDWYRPDLMAVVAVGDFDVNEVEKLIKEKFSSIPATKNPKPRVVYDVPAQEGLRISVSSDKEATYPSVRYEFMHPPKPTETVNDLYVEIQTQLISQMLRSRFAEYAASGTTNYSMAFGYYGSQVRAKDQFTMFGIASENAVEGCLKDLMIEAKRIKQHGFEATELERAKVAYMTQVASQLKEKDNTPSRRLVMEYVYHFLSGNPAPGIEFEYNFTKESMNKITVESLNKLATQLLSSKDQVIVITGPEKNGLEYPDAKSIANLAKVVEQLEVEPYVDNTNDEPFLANEPVAGKIVSEKKIEGFNATEWTLANGARIIVKTTDFKNDEILFSASSYGGYSLYELSEKASAQNAASVVDESGIGNFDQTELRKKLTGKRMYLYPYIGAYSEGFQGMSSPDDLETFMQYLHLYFTKPRVDPKALEVFKKQQATFIENQTKSPEGFYAEQYNKIITQNNPWAQWETLETLEKIELDKCLKVFSERFDSPSDFTFYFVGNVNQEYLKSLVEKYLASIPSGTCGEFYKDLGIRPPSGKISATVKKGSEPKSTVSLTFSGKYKASKFNSMAPQALEKALGIKLRQALREDQGGTYGVGCSVRINDVPYHSYTVSIQFGCAPENVDKLIAVALKE